MLVINSVIFDLDGVVIDSNREIEAFWRGWAAKENVEFNNQTLVQHILGRTTTETVEAVFSQSTHETRHRIVEAAKAFDAAMRPPLLSGLRPFLLNLFNTTIPLGLVTSSPSQRVQVILEQHGIYHWFKHLITGEDVTHGKSHPEPYLKMSNYQRVAPQNCLVFEDSNSGIESALEAGMHVIAVGNTRYNNAYAVIKDFVDLDLSDDKIIFRDGKTESILLDSKK